MFKVITSNSAGYSLPVSPHSQRGGAGVTLEKMSGTRAGQLDFLKTAARVDPRVLDWIKKAPLDFDRNVYVIVVPLGADESWEETVNGDAFARADLKSDDPSFGHLTFNTTANAFKDHRNQDPKLGFGSVPFTCYNDAMDRVEGIWALDKVKAPEVGAAETIARVLSGTLPEISMGCRVPFDVCSLCGNRARSLAEYCTHPKVPGWGAIDALGRKMRVFNPKPVFFDLSDVGSPAAPEAHSLGFLTPELRETVIRVKTSGARIWLPSAVYGAARYGWDTGSVKLSSPLAIKVSDLIKEVPALMSEVVDPLLQEEIELDEDLLKKSGCAGRTAATILSTLAGLGIVCSPRELATVFQMDGQMSVPPSRALIAEMWDAASSDSPLVSPQLFRPDLAAQCTRLMPGRSVLMPHLAPRVRKSLAAPPRVSVDMTVRIRGSRSEEDVLQYASYFKTLAYQMARHIEQVLAAYPAYTEVLGRPENLTKASLSEEGARIAAAPASALLPALCILRKAGKAEDETQLLKVAEALNRPGMGHLFGGLL